MSARARRAARARYFDARITRTHISYTYPLLTCYFWFQMPKSSKDSAKTAAKMSDKQISQILTLYPTEEQFEDIIPFLQPSFATNDAIKIIPEEKIKKTLITEDQLRSLDLTVTAQEQTFKKIKNQENCFTYVTSATQTTVSEYLKMSTSSSDEMNPDWNMSGKKKNHYCEHLEMKKENILLNSHKSYDLDLTTRCSLVRRLGNFPGITATMFYIGLNMTIFSLHKENMDLCAFSVLLWGKRLL